MVYYEGRGSIGHFWVQDFGRWSWVYPIIIINEAAETDTPRSRNSCMDLGMISVSETTMMCGQIGSHLRMSTIGDCHIKLVNI